MTSSMLLKTVKIGLDEQPSFSPSSRAVSAATPSLLTISSAASIISSFENLGFGGIKISP